MKKKMLGEVLRERGKISSTDLAKAIEEQQGKVIHLGELMLERGLVNKLDLIAALAEVTHVPYVDCEIAQIEPRTLKLIPRSMAERCCVLPLAREGMRVVVAMAEPQNLHTLDELRFTCGMDISPRMAFRSEILAAIEKYYEGAELPEAATDAGEKSDTSQPADEPEMEFTSTSSRQSTLETIQEVQAELTKRRTPAVRLVSTVIAAATKKGASDIHIEPQATDTAVRIRVDGVLRDLLRVPRNLQNPLVSRIKILADMDIAERRAPQDGRIMVQMGTKKLDLRVSTLPTQYGEKVVMRLLESEAPQASFYELGMAPEVIEGLNRVLEQPQGMLLVTGPTGSGKSTTLYTSLNLLRKVAVNIVTVEDPVEYVLPGINQVHVNTKAGLTFASSLRSILRQDPNVIMVGEIRDKETAEIAMKASQTGHLVLSTLHTNDSIAALTRLLDLGIPGYVIAPSVTAIMAQRLVRKLCSCHDQVLATPEYLSRLMEAGLLERVPTQRIAVGCAECDNTGYKGRLGIYELLVLDEAIRHSVRSATRPDEIRNLARSAGMKLMQEDALDKLKTGLTTLDEVLRVVPMEKIVRPQCSACSRELAAAFLFCPYCGAKRSGQSRTAPVPRPGLVKEGAVRT